MDIAVPEKARESLHKRNVSRSARRAQTLSRIDPASAEVARYVADLAAELSEIAGKAKLDTLAYFLSMARLEAELKSRPT